MKPENDAVHAFLDDLRARQLELHSLMILRHGKTVAEGWWAPYAPEIRHLLYSLSKSFTSTAAGMAIAEGRFTLDDTVISFFPDDLPETVSANLAAMRVRDLLAMATGHDADTTATLAEFADGNWARAFLAQPVPHAPGTHFLYNSGATYMVAAILHKTTGESLTSYLTPRLFEPLGIENPHWETCPRGIEVGGWGLSVTTGDIARFGQLYLQNGVWNGVQLVPENWVREATSAQISNGDNPDSDWAQGYGYQFWRCRHGAYRGDGAFGQYCVVLPEQDGVIAITAGLSDMQAVLNGVWTHLLPRFDSIHTGHIDGLALPGPHGSPTSEAAARVSGRTLRFEGNDQKIESATLDFAPNETILTLRDAEGAHEIACGTEGWAFGATRFLRGRVGRSTPPSDWKVAAAGAWTDPNTFAARLCFYETPFAPTLTFSFGDDDSATLDVRGNVGFGPAERPLLRTSR